MNATEKKVYQSSETSSSLTTRIAIGWLLALISLSLAAWVGSLIADHWDVRFEIQNFFQGIVMSGLVLTGIWIVRKRLDRGSPASIGVGSITQGIPRFLLGIGLVLIPLVITICCTSLFGWGKVQINQNPEMLNSLFLGFITIFIFEALPEELVFRGYIYSNLNTRYKRWLSAALTIGLFALLPVLLSTIQKHIFGIEMYFGGNDHLTSSYIITMIFFGAFVQYLRILTNNIWTGIGFHLMFVFLNKLIGIEPTVLIQFTEFTSEKPVQITFIITLLLMFIALIIYPRISKQKIGWKEVIE